MGRVRGEILERLFDDAKLLVAGVLNLEQIDSVSIFVERRVKIVDISVDFRVDHRVVLVGVAHTRDTVAMLAHDE